MKQRASQPAPPARQRAAKPTRRPVGGNQLSPLLRLSSQVGNQGMLPVLRSTLANDCLEIQQTAWVQGHIGEALNPDAMPRPLRVGLERLSGMDLSEIRVHRNSSNPAKVNALAYTQAEDIHIAPGQERQLPHEGWHAVQQMQGRVKPTLRTRDVLINDDAELEREADLMGAKALHMGRQLMGSAQHITTAPWDGAKDTSESECNCNIRMRVARPVMQLQRESAVRRRARIAWERRSDYTFEQRCINVPFSRNYRVFRNAVAYALREEIVYNRNERNRRFAREMVGAFPDLGEIHQWHRDDLRTSQDSPVPLLATILRIDAPGEEIHRFIAAIRFGPHCITEQEGTEVEAARPSAAEILQQVAGRARRLLRRPTTEPHRRLQCLTNMLLRPRVDDRFIPFNDMDPVREQTPEQMEVLTHHAKEDLATFHMPDATDVDFLRALEAVDHNIFTSVGGLQRHLSIRAGVANPWARQLQRWVHARQQDRNSIYQCYRPRGG